MDDVIVILRAAGERSLDASLALVHAQVPRDRVFVVEERPFERALRTTYERGIQQASKWTVTLDADVLLQDGAIAALIGEAERMPESYVQIEGRIFDKLTGLFRQAGHRVYRTSLLKEALRHVPEPATVLRPEYETLLKMTALGHRSRRVAHVVGLHDFEQYYRDIYRKAYVHARKSRGWVPLMVERCLRYAGSDRDFDVVLKGLCDGLTTNDAVSIDTRHFEGRLSDAWLKSIGLEEKPPLGGAQLSSSALQQTCRDVLRSHVAPIFDTVDEPPPPLTARHVHWRHYRDRIADKGVVSGTMSSIGSVIKRVGLRLETL